MGIYGGDGDSDHYVNGRDLVLLYFMVILLKDKFPKFGILIPFGFAFTSS